MATWLRTLLILCLLSLPACSHKGEDKPARAVPTVEYVLTPAILYPSPEPTPENRTFLVAVPQSLPTPEALEYVFDEVKGTVLVMSGSSQPVTAEEDLVVGQDDRITTGPGSEATLTLNDDTMFHLSENSEVQIARLEKQKTGGFFSRLSLIKGKVLSEVEKLTQSHSNFEVESGGVICGVRGTGFEVQKDGEEIHTRTFHGLVEMQRQGQAQKIAAGSHGIFSGKSRKFLAMRSLGSAEKGRYQNWLGMKTAVQHRRVERGQALARFRGLAPEERRKVIEGWKGTDRHERFKYLRGAMGNPGGWSPRPGGPGPNPRNRGNSRPEHRGSQDPGAGHRKMPGQGAHSRQSPNSNATQGRPDPAHRMKQDHRNGPSGRGERGRSGPGQVPAPAGVATEKKENTAPAHSQGRQERRHGLFGHRENGSNAAPTPAPAPTVGTGEAEKKEPSAQKSDGLEGLRKLFEPKKGGSGATQRPWQKREKKEESKADSDKKDGESPKVEATPSEEKGRGPGNWRKKRGDKTGDESGGDSSQDNGDDPAGGRHHGPRGR